MVQWSQGYPTLKSLSRRWRTHDVGHRFVVGGEFVHPRFKSIVVLIVVIIAGSTTSIAVSVSADFHEKAPGVCTQEL